jgi:hypothetical protein
VCAPDGNCVTPERIVEGLIVAVKQLQTDGVLNGGQGNSLVVKLEGTLAKLSRASVGAGCNQLGAFIKQVMDFGQEGILTEAQAMFLIETASNARSALGCVDQTGTSSRAQVVPRLFGAVCESTARTPADPGLMAQRAPRGTT